jgi:hypothetical protein
VRNDDIHNWLVIASIEEKLIQYRLRWFGHVHRRPPEAPVHRCIIGQDNNVKRGRSRPNLTWEEAIKMDLKECNIPMEMCLDRSVWKEAIHVPEPWLGLFLFSALKSFSSPLSLSFSFWWHLVGFKLYPTLTCLGLKDYVDVDVQLVMFFRSELAVHL